MRLAEIAIALAAKIHWMQPLNDYDARPRLLMGGGNPGITRIYDSIAATMHFHYPRHAILLVANNQPFDTAKTHTYLRKVWTLLRVFHAVLLLLDCKLKGYHQPSTGVNRDRDRAASFSFTLSTTRLQRVSPLIHNLKVLQDIFRVVVFL